MDRQQIITALKLNTGILRDFVSAIPAEFIMKKRQDFWSIYEHIAHLALSQVMLLRRIEDFIKSEKPVITPHDPADKSKKENTHSVAEMLNTFSKYRGLQVEMLGSCDEKIWAREASHPQYDSYTFEILVRHILLHDGTHMYRMEELWLVKDGFIKPL